MISLLRQLLKAISENTRQQKRLADLIENTFNPSMNKHEVVQQERKVKAEMKVSTLEFLKKLDGFKQKKTEAATSAIEK